MLQVRVRRLVIIMFDKRVRPLETTLPRLIVPARSAFDGSRGKKPLGRGRDHARIGRSDAACGRRTGGGAPVSTYATRWRSTSGALLGSRSA